MDGQWTPIRERLPLKGGFYLVTSADHWNVTTAQYLPLGTTRYEGNPHWEVAGQFPLRNVTAWMPLPVPFKS